MAEQSPKPDRRFRAPPALFVAPLVIGIVICRFFPVRFLPAGAALPVGLAAVALGIALFAWAVVTMRQAGTSPQPSQPSITLVTWGPFRYSRNPIYLAYTVLYLGIAAAVNSLWALALLPVSLALVARLSIRPEEEYLEETFGDAYRTYRASVRRWL